MTRWITVLAGCVLATVATHARAVEPYQEYHKHIETAQSLTALTDELMGDSVSLYNGATEFTATDIDLPGNNALPVRLARRFSMVIHPAGPPPQTHDPDLGGIGNWHVDVPYITGTYPSPGWENARCSAPAMPVPSGALTAMDVWHGISVHIPGGGDRALLRLLTDDVPQPTDGVARGWSTRERDMVTCIQMKSGLTGEGFLLQTTDGLKYYFDVAVAKDGGRMQYNAGGGIAGTVGRTKYFLLASKVADRFGNSVTYAYNAAGHPTRISSSDGRSITLTYSNGRLASASANGRQWSYSYGSSGENSGKLTGVQLPDGSRWSYAHVGTLTPPTESWDGNSGPNCNGKPPATSAGFTYTITHPSGAIGRFEFGNWRHPRSGVHLSACLQRVSNGQIYYKLAIPNYFDVMTLHRKTLSGPGLSTREWNYEYPRGSGAMWGSRSSPGAYPCETCASEKVVTVHQPDGTVKKYRYGYLYAGNEGRLLGTTTLDASGAVKRIDSTEYMSEDEVVGQNFHPVYGYGWGSGDPSSGAVRPVVQQTVELDGELYAMTVKKGCGGSAKYCFDTFGQPTVVTRVSSLGFSREEQTEYSNDTAQWILGQVSKRTVAGVAAEETSYDSLARPSVVKAYGKVKHKLTYYPSNGTDATQRGTIASVSDGRDTSSFDTTIFLSSWKRGIPQLITHPPTVDQASAVTEKATVDDNGWIISITDETGAKTCYAYDAMGRITKVTYPSEAASNTCDSSTWLPTTSSFVQTASSTTEYGIPGGHWKHTVDTGASRKVTYFDAMWRPLVEEQFDNTNSTTAANTRTILVKRYDLAGRPAFTSYPMRTLSSYASTSLKGTSTGYDALGRVTSLVQDSEYGALTTKTAYLAASGSVHAHMRVTDPSGNVTKTWFQAFDQPSQDAPTAIQHPEGAFTDIERDLLGKPKSITRRNAANSIVATRHYVYDAAQQLCKAVEPETGAKIMAYDAANNVIWSASGQDLLSTNSCNTDNVPVAQRVTRSYDARGRVKTLVFPDNLGNSTFVYRADGKVSQRMVDNGGPDLVITNHAYFRRGLPKTDQLKLDGFTWNLGYGYDALGNQSKVMYPDGVEVDYAPNALGQPTRAGSYATGVSYHPNGGMAKFTYGNGIVHTMTQNARQLPERSLDSGGVLDDTYLYDANGNVDSITDGRSGNRGNRTMTYDGLNRLRSVTSPMFSGGATYTYDVLDNLVRVKAPGRDHTYSYDTKWRLQTVANTSGGTAVHGLAYDPRGNLQSKDSQAFVFDMGNRLREVTGKEAYVYDGEGRRVRARHPTQGSIYSFYGHDGVLRAQRDERAGKATDYIMLNGSLVARISTPVMAVTSLTVPAYSNNGSYTASWAAVTNATRYELQEQVGSGSWSKVHDGASLSKAFSGKASGTYGYRVRACNGSTCGAWSAVAIVSVTLPPGAAPPLSAPATALNGNYTVSWTSATGATSYTLEESANGGAWMEAYKGGALSKTYSGKVSGSYRYRVKACNTAGCSAYSATRTVQSIRPPTAAPTITVPANNTTGAYTVSWTSVSGADSYTLEEQVGSGSWSAYAAIAGASKAISGKATATYTYRVKACNAAGCGPASGTKSVAVLLAPASGPAITVPGSNSTGSYTVSWGAVATATRYEIQESVDGGSWTAFYSGTARSKAVSGKTTASYRYRGRACNSTGCGPYGATKTVSVLTKPATPSFKDSLKKIWYKTGPTGSTVIHIQCSVSWTAVVGAATYELKAGTASGSGSVQYSGPDTSVQGSYNTAGYCAETQVLRACNSVGCSGWTVPYTQRVKYMNDPPPPGGGGGDRPRIMEAKGLGESSLVNDEAEDEVSGGGA